MTSAGASGPLAPCAVSQAESVPPHVFAFADGWSLWRWVCLRGAGFPIDLVEPLADPECARLAVTAQRRASDVECLQDRLIAVLTDAHRSASGERRKAFSVALKAARKRRLPRDPLDAPREVPALVDAIRRAGEVYEREWSAFVTAFDRSRGQARAHLRTVAASDRFARAVLWQNRPVFQRAVAALAQEPVASDRASTPSELLTLNYLQRYATKNDTIGFFGPKCWARIEPEPRGIEASYGGGLVRRCGVHFESWAIDRIAQVLQSEHDLALWLTPRRSPLVRIDEAAAVRPFSEPQPLSPASLAVLRASDGSQSAARVATALVDRQRNLFRGVDDVYTAIDELRSAGLLTLRFELPLMDTPEQILSRQIAAIDDEPLRTACASRLGALERGRHAAAKAADAVALDEALTSVEGAFQQITGATPHRADDRAPRGKGIVYNDCVRDADIVVGEELLAGCSGALGVLLDSVRWFTHAVACAYSTEFDALFARLLAGTKAGVNAAEYWLEARSLLFDDKRAPLGVAEAELQRRWREILPLPPDQRRVTCRSAALRPHASRVFDAPHAGWRYSRYVSIDLHVAGDSLEAVASGRRHFVFGELHLGNALNTNTFVAQHPAPEQLRSMMAADALGPRAILVPPKTWPGASGRTAPPLAAPGDTRILVDPDVHGTFDERTIPIADCSIERDEDGGLVLRMPGRRGREAGATLPILEAFASALTHIVFSEFQPFTLDAHRPRLTIDDVVVLRECWRFQRDGLPFMTEADDRRRFARLQEWRAAHQLPRWCFVRISGEGKPMYLDLDSPLLAELFASRLKRALNKPTFSLQVSEMLPQPGEEWLSDRTGRRYTSEWRMVAVDRIPI